MRPAEAVLGDLATMREDLAFMETQYHSIRVRHFVEDRTAKTVKEREYGADYVALDLHQDLLLTRCRVRSLEDELRTVLTLNGE